MLHSRILKDLADLNDIQEIKKLKEGISRMNRKYVLARQSGEADTGSQLMDGSADGEGPPGGAALQEVMRQKAFLERTVASLREQMKKQGQNQRLEYLRKMRENEFLVAELARLKKELKHAKGYSLSKSTKSLKSGADIEGS